MKPILLSVLLTAAALPCICATVPSAIFHAEFDRDFNALTSSGTTQGKHSREVLWESLGAFLKEGVTGQAAVVGVDDNKNGINIIYENKGQIDSSKGSVVFWFSPMDWDGNDDEFHILFRAWGKDASMICYKIPQKRLLFLFGPERMENGKKIWTQATASAADLKAGQWYFYAATWDSDEITLYLNGRQLDRKKLTASPGEFSGFGIGGRTPEKWVHPRGTTLMDDVMLYNVALTPEHVRARYSSYNRNLEVDESVSAAPAKIVTLVDEKKGVMTLRFVENRADRDGGPLPVSIKFIRGNGDVAWNGVSKSEMPQHSVEVPLSSLAADSYKIELSAASKDGSITGKTEFDFLVPSGSEPWQRVATADDDTLPPPWTPVKFADGTFSCWNRSIEFNGSLLPTQLTSGGQKLLDGKIALVANGRPLPLEGPLKCVHASDASVRLEGKATGGAFDSELKTTCEFDGFLWFDLTLTPKADEIEPLSLDIPLRKEASTLFNAMHKQYMDFKPGSYGYFREYAMNLFNGNKIIFVGNDFAGLEWFCETLEDWHVKEMDKTLQLIPMDTHNILRLNMIDHKIKATRPLVFRFGIQVLPVRPETPQWRLFRLNGANEKHGVNAFWKFATRHNSLCKEHVRQDYQEDKAKQFKRYERLFHYTAGFTMSPLVPEWPYHCLEWSKTPPALGTYGCEDIPMEFFGWCCPKSKSIRDYYTYNLKKRVEELDIRDLYVDNQDAQLCSNTAHGCGFVAADGNSYPSFNILSTRDLTKRIYKIIKSHNPEGEVFRHMSQKPYMPALSFTDYMCDGECYNKTVAEDESYLNILEPSLMRACYRGTPYGVPNYFIPQFQRAISLHSPIRNRYPDAWQKPEDMVRHEPVLRHFVGYFLVHDAPMWPSFGVSLKKWWRIQDACGFDGNERFVFYGEEACPFKSEGRFMVSCYVTKEGKLIVIAMNDTNQSVPSIAYDAAKLKMLGVNGMSLKNLEDGKDVAMADGTIQAAVPPRDYILLGNFNPPAGK